MKKTLSSGKSDSGYFLIQHEWWSFKDNFEK